MKPKKKHKKRIISISLIIVGLLLAVFIVLCNFLVSACLVPSFMEKLDAFEEVTEQSYGAQIKTNAISENHKAMWADTNEWLKKVKEDQSFKKYAIYTDDGYKLVGIEFLPENEIPHKYALVLHGYTGWKEEMYPYAKHYVEEGYKVFVPDMRCSGQSEGDFIGMGYTDSRDCLKWINYMIQEDPEAEIIIHGQSMGASTALMMSGLSELPSNVCAIVSDAAYTDAYSMFGDKITEWFSLPPFPLVDGSCLMLRLRGGYDLKKADALSAVKRSNTPILFIHGDKDAMIPVSMCYELYEAAASSKEIYIVEGVGHAQTVDKDPEEFWSKIDEFLISAQP